MTNRPIPRRGLLGCWFLTDRGITYDAGANEAIDRSGRGNHATYQNGVTVGTAGDPSRDFGAADFDASSNQYADVGDPLAVSGAHAIAAVFKPEGKGVVAGNDDGNNGTQMNFLFDKVGFGQADDSANRTFVRIAAEDNTYHSAVGFFTGSEVGITLNDTQTETAPFTAQSEGVRDFNISRRADDAVYFDGEIAAVGRYDLTVPNAPEPSEIARRWDRLTDIPATR